jgi:hypothetical protein
MHLQLRILRLQYSTLGICAAIVDITSTQCALYCKLSSKDSAHRPVYARELWIRTYTMHLQLRIFRLQYSSERICAATVHITTIQCVLYCKLGARYSAHRPVYAVWNVVPDIYKVFAAPYIYASIFSWRYLRYNCRYHMNSMRLILQTWCQIQRTSSSLRYVNCGPGHIQGIYSSAYLGFNIHL